MKIIEKVDRCHEAISAIRPFEGHMLKQLKDYYRIGVTWSGNAIEGNSLTISEIKVILEDGLTVAGRPLRDFYETVGHGKAYNFMFTLIGEKRISVTDIRNMHRLFYKEINEENAGVWRKQPVVVSGTLIMCSRIRTNWRSVWQNWMPGLRTNEVNITLWFLPVCSTSNS